MSRTDRMYYIGRRLHSLSGIVPVGAFLVQHVYGNALAIKGSEAYDEHVRNLLSMPGVVFLEWFGIYLPILFHGILGIYYAINSKSNTSRYGYQRNWAYVMQRITGVLLLAYIVMHVWTTTFTFSEDQKMNMYATMQQYFDDMPWMVGLYILGMISAAFHLSNGIWSFCIMWGITITRKSQQLVWKMAMGIFVILSVLGVWSVLVLANGPAAEHNGTNGSHTHHEHPHK